MHLQGYALSESFRVWLELSEVVGIGSLPESRYLAHPAMIGSCILTFMIYLDRFCCDAAGG